MLCITLLILILYPIVSTSSQFDISFKPNSFFVILALIVGLIMSYSTYALVLVYIITFISSLIWSVKAFNLISDKKHTFTQYSWLTFIFRILPLFSLYTRYRILKDLYTEHSTKDTYEKRLIYIWYIFYLLVWGALFFMTRKDLESDSPLYFWVVWIMIFFAIISFCYFNKILKRINKFQDSVIKGDAENINIEVKENKIENKIETKKFNYKNILYVLWGLIIVCLIIAFWISYYGKIKHSNTSEKQISISNNVNVEEKKEEKNNITSDQQMFENNIKCQEYLYNFKSEFWTWYKNFSAFFSPKLNTCLAWYEFEWYIYVSPWSKDHDVMYFVTDLFDSSSTCYFGNRMRLVTEEFWWSDFSIESQIKICSCENLEQYDEKEIKLCNLWVGEMKTLRWNEINYLKWN